MPKTLPAASPFGPPTGVTSDSLDGIVVDDRKAEFVGSWTKGTGLKGYVDYGYLYASPDSGAKAVFKLKVADKANYDVRIGFQPHENRGKSVPVSVKIGNQKKTVRVNMTEKPPLKNGFYSVGKFDIPAGGSCEITIDTVGAKGFVHVDAIQLVKVE